MNRHDLDVFPVPREKKPLYINEPALIDPSIVEEDAWKDRRLPDNQLDNIRVYIPLDLNKEAILRRLDHIIDHYHETNERNESDFSFDVERLIAQVEIYDQVWFVRHMPSSGDHSEEAKELVKEFIGKLEQIPDSCTELFPFDVIERLQLEYLSDILP